MGCGERRFLFAADNAEDASTKMLCPLNHEQPRPSSSCMDKDRVPFLDRASHGQQIAGRHALQHHGGCYGILDAFGDSHQRCRRPVRFRRIRSERPGPVGDAVPFHESLNTRADRHDPAGRLHAQAGRQRYGIEPRAVIGIDEVQANCGMPTRTSPSEPARRLVAQHIRPLVRKLLCGAIFLLAASHTGDVPASRVYCAIRAVMGNVSVPNTHPYLQGPWAPVDDEQLLFDLEVEGAACGLDFYVRSGPNPYPGRGDLRYHWLSGDGMVHGIRLGGGRALWYRNRWVNAPDVARVRQQPAPPVVDTLVPDGTGNANALMHAQRLYVFSEMGLPYELSDSLETLTMTDFGGPMPAGSITSAH